MSDIQPTEADREEAQRLLDHIYSLHGFISQKDRMTRQLSKPELNARRKEREDALIEIILAYRADAVKAERENASRLAQEARADERRRCAYRAIDYLRKHRFDEDEGVGLCSAILKGTEPAKVSEDVERDIEVVNETLELFPGAGDARDAFARLVARLKDLDDTTRKMWQLDTQLTQALEAVEKMREALIDRATYSFYYDRDVPHQSQHEHCRCRKCTDSRVKGALAATEPATTKIEPISNTIKQE